MVRMRDLLAWVVLSAAVAGGCGDDARMMTDAGEDAGGMDGGDDAGTDAAMPGPRPGKRSDIAGVADEMSGAIVLFGGDDGPIIDQIPQPNYIDDTWIFEPSAGWTELSVSGPSARGRYAVAYDPEGRRMLLFGGRYRAATSGPYTLYNDLWAFDFASRTWSMVHDGSGTAPAPRFFAAAAYDPGSDSFYVSGGGTNTDALRVEVAEDLWRFDGTSWTEVRMSGVPPSTRLYVGYAYDSMRNRLVIYAGQVGDLFSPGYRDLFGLDLATGAWTRLDTGTSGPAGRWQSMVGYDAMGDRYIVFGGHADPGTTNDLWAFDPDGGSWTNLSAGDQFTGGSLGCLGNPREIPEDFVTQDLAAPERRQGGILAVVGSTVWLVMGESDCSDHLDDVWSFDSAWTEVVPSRSGETCARRGDDCMCLCL
jgi:hypothetical protein